jgi:hypothetical protein
MLKKYHEREVPVQNSFELTTTSAVWQDDNKLVHFYYIVQQQQHDDAYIANLTINFYVDSFTNST